MEAESARESERTVLAKMAAVQGDLEGERQVSLKRYNQVSAAEQEMGRLQARIKALEEEVATIPVLQKQMADRER